MIDGLYYVLRELDAHRERPVILLVTDGFDTGSIHERAEVNDLAERRPDLTVFTIGVKLPPLQSGAPPGYLSTRRFLQRLARRTNGEFFDDPTGARLKRVFDRVRELLENEATLTFLDPDPQAGARAAQTSDPAAVRRSSPIDRAATSARLRQVLQPQRPGRNGSRLSGGRDSRPTLVPQGRRESDHGLQPRRHDGPGNPLQLGLSATYQAE
jgi:hypothetical protein